MIVLLCSIAGPVGSAHSCPPSSEPSGGGASFGPDSASSSTASTSESASTPGFASSDVASTEGPPSDVVGPSLGSSHPPHAAMATSDEATSDRARAGLSIIDIPFELWPSSSALKNLRGYHALLRRPTAQCRRSSHSG